MASADKLRAGNLAVGLLDTLSATAILLLGNGAALPVTASYQAGGSGVPDPTTLFKIPVAWGVAAFLLVSAAVHLAVLVPHVFAWHLGNLAVRVDVVRWVRHSVSSSLMVVLIGQVAGIGDLAALTVLFALTASMFLFFWLQEVYESPETGGWLPFTFGCLAGVVPWLAIVFYLVAPGENIASGPPGFAVAIALTMLGFFTLFVLNLWLRYRGLGLWRDHLGTVYLDLGLGLAARSVLAWLIFARLLVG